MSDSIIKKDISDLIIQYRGYLNIDYPYPNYSKKEMLSDIIIDLQNILDKENW